MRTKLMICFVERSIKNAVPVGIYSFSEDILGVLPSYRHHLQDYTLAYVCEPDLEI